MWNGATPVALKKLKSKEQFSEFLTEANILVTLQHPNIVQYFGIYTVSNFEYIVMEKMSEGNLRSILPETKGLDQWELTLM